MKVGHVEVIVEEPSMEQALRVLLPRLLDGVSFQIYAHQCKSELLARLPGRLLGYSSWLPENWRIVIVVDRDDEDCIILKNALEGIAAIAGLRTRTTAASPGYQVVNRLAIEELEAWYFGDWNAVRRAYPRVSSAVPSQARYREPDGIRGGTWEAFERILQKAGYFRSGLRKIEAAHAIAREWDPDINRSHSFGVFRDTMREMAGK